MAGLPKVTQEESDRAPGPQSSVLHRTHCLPPMSERLLWPGLSPVSFPRPTANQKQQETNSPVNWRWQSAPRSLGLRIAHRSKALPV